jgi:hypothetical protein
LVHFVSDGIELYSCDVCKEKFTQRIVLMMHKDINHSHEYPSFVDCGESIKEEDKKEKIKENVYDPSSMSYSTKTYIKEEIKEEVNESDEGQDVDDSNLDTDNLVDCREYVQVQMNLTK